MRNTLDFYLGKRRAGQVAPPYSPSDSIPNLTVWLETTNSITGATNASQWDDATLNANHVTQGTGAAQPLIVDPDANLKSPRKSLSFDGGDYMTHADNASLRVGSADFFIATVSKMSSGILMGKDSFSGGSFIGYFIQYNDGDSINKVKFTTRNSTTVGQNALIPSGTTNTTAFHVIMAARTSGVLTLYVDNVLMGTLAESGVTDTDSAAAFKVGTADEALNAKFNGQHAAILLAKTTLSAGIRSGLYNYLRDKYIP